MVQLEEAFILQVLFIWLLRREDHPQARLHLVLAEAFLQALQIERVLDELRVNFNQKFVAIKLAEPLDPSDLLILHGRII